MAKINVKGTEITVIQIEDADYISLTDMAHSQMEEHIIIKWLSLKSTIEYIGEWEALFNSNFNYTEFGTIKNKEEEQKSLGWSAKRELAKINYNIHTSAISRNLIPKKLSKEQINFIYANEADVLNVAIFGRPPKNGVKKILM